MAKYIVELNELPNNCFECPLVMDDGFVTGVTWCSITEKSVNENCREKDCPIKTID